MTDAKVSAANDPIKSAVWRPAAVLAVAILLTGAFIAVAPRSQAMPEFAAQTGLPCGQCHVNSAGSGKLKPFGETFRRNGFKLQKKKK